MSDLRSSTPTPIPTRRYPDPQFWAQRPLGFTRRMRQPAHPHLGQLGPTSPAQRGLLERIASLLP